MIRLLSTLTAAGVLLLGTGAAAIADELSSGTPAPRFELADQNGKVHTLEDYRDKWVALYFYPKDDTPGCTTEACEFRDDIFKFRRMNCEVLGVSLDDEASHKAFAEKHGLPFPLLADTEGTAAEAYGVKTRMLGMAVARRHTFLIDPDGNIARHYTEVNPKSHSKEILADLQELQKQP
jgi:peroxiredoxin Q/BCP